jgi:hypothetical protein
LITLSCKFARAQTKTRLGGCSKPRTIIRWGRRSRRSHDGWNHMDAAVPSVHAKQRTPRGPNWSVEDRLSFKRFHSGKWRSLQEKYIGCSPAVCDTRRRKCNTQGCSPRYLWAPCKQPCNHG